MCSTHDALPDCCGIDELALENVTDGTTRRHIARTGGATSGIFGPGADEGVSGPIGGCPFMEIIDGCRRP
jgi:hypothetical protein